MIKARHDSVIYPFFRWYIRRIIGWNFHQVELIGSLQPSNKAILLIANHVSWWDGFWALYLNGSVFHRHFHVMMLEEQLRKYWYLRFCGGFSVQKKSRSILESLDYATQLLKQPKNLVLLFPQGEIGSQHQMDIHFERGAERILEKLGIEEVQVIFMVSLTDYLSHKKPLLTFFLHEYAGAHRTSELNTAFNTFYQQCKVVQSKKVE